MRPDEPSPTARPAVLVLAAVTLLATVLRIPWLTAEGLWFDEVYSVVVALQDVPELLAAARVDQTNPPGFYLLLWGWIRLGSVDEAWLRLLPALAGILTPAAVALLARELGGRWPTALLAGMLAAASPLLLAMSLEVRAYAPLALAATTGLILAVRVARRTGSTTPGALILALATVDVALVSFHYFGALAILAQAAVLLDVRSPGTERPRGTRNVARALALAAVPAVLLLGGWLAAVIGAAPEGELWSHAAWIQEGGWRDLIRFAGQLAIGDLGYPTASVLIAVVTAAAVALPFVRRDGATADVASGARVAALATVLPVAAVLVAEAVTPRALWVPRYLIGAVAPLLVAVALAVEQLGARAHRLCTITLAGWALVAGLYDIGARPRKPDWARVLAELTRDAPTTLCVDEPFVGLPFQYYALRGRLPVRVIDLRACERGTSRTWAVFRSGADSSLSAVVSRGGRPGPRLSLLTEKPPTEARRVQWAR